MICCTFKHKPYKINFMKHLYARSVRLLFFVTFNLLSSFSASSQDWKCYQPGVVSWYSNGFGFIRAIRVDAVTASGSDSIYHLYRTPRPARLGASGPSWVGGNVRRTAAGEYTFENYTDTVFLKSLAPVGASWMFFNDTGTNHYKATVTSVDTATILGVIDSVKTILITSYRGSSVDNNDTLNGLEIRLSKAHGFVQVFDLYNFPFHNQDLWGMLRYDYYTMRVINFFGDDQTYYGDLPFVYPEDLTKFNTLFNLIDFQFPTRHDICKFAVGDVFCHKTTSNWPTPGGNFASAGDNYLDSVIYVDSISPQLTKIAYREFGNYYDRVATSGGTFSNYYPVDGIDTLIADTTNLFVGAFYNFSSSFLPEDSASWGNYEWYYRPADTTRGLTGKYYALCEVPRFEHSGHIVVFKEGFGKIHKTEFESRWIPDGNPDPTFKEYTMDYSVKGSVIRGSRCPVYPLEVKEVSPGNGVPFYPNPVNDYLSLNIPAGTMHAAIISLPGKEIWAGELTEQRSKVDVSQFPDGLYLLRLQAADGSIKVHKLQVQH
ncbi:MAG: T9SS C-terminal target domain-containing protein [Chitinophagia bacterium]|nr:T9SS C-terminal target domain-containing protein [Chitinophagia bacterium]